MRSTSYNFDEEDESCVTKKISQEFHGRESRILSPRSNLDKFGLYSQDWVHSGNPPGISRVTDMEKLERNEDRSQNDPHLEVGTTVNRSPQLVNSDLDPVFHTNSFFRFP